MRDAKQINFPAKTWHADKFPPPPTTKTLQSDGDGWGVNETYQPHFIPLHISHLSFFNFPSLCWNFCCFLRDEMKMEGKLSCYHFSVAYFMASVFEESFTKSFHFIWCFQKKGRESENSRLSGSGRAGMAVRQGEKEMEIECEWEAAHGFRMKQLLWVCEKGCSILLLLYRKQITFKNRFLSQLYYASFRTRDTLSSINFYIKIHHWSTLIFNLCFHSAIWRKIFLPSERGGSGFDIKDPGIDDFIEFFRCSNRNCQAWRDLEAEVETITLLST
jgi:hypothetical protein